LSVIETLHLGVADKTGRVLRLDTVDNALGDLCQHPVLPLAAMSAPWIVIAAVDVRSGRAKSSD
jgi:hypothetical protein